MQDVWETAHGVCESGAERLESELSMVRYIAWVIPSIGFIGTVRGIGEALGQAHKAVEGDIAGVTQSLGGAVNSTFIALLISIVLMLLLFDNVWISPGQWGSGALVLFVFSIAGVMVLFRASRSDVSFAFLGFYAAIVFGRALYLGDPWQIPWRQMQSGALLLFAFFMISDPKTTPNTAIGRFAFASVVAIVAFSIQFIFYEPNGPILALVMSAPLVPLIDALSRGRNYQWIRPQFATRHSQSQPGV